MNTTLPLRKIRDFGEKISDTIRFIKLNWKNLLIMYGIFVLPFLLVAVFLGAGYFMDAFTQIGGGRIDQLADSWKIFLAIVLLFFGVNASATSIYVYMKYWELNNQAPTLGEVAKGMPKPFLTNFLYSLLIAGLFIGVILLFSLVFAGSGAGLGMTAFLLLAGTLGIIFFMAYLILIYPANSIGGNEFGSPLRAAWVLLKDNWWASLGYVFVLMMIFYIFSFISQMFMTMLMGIMGLFKPEAQAAGMGKGLSVVYGLTILVQQVFYIIVFVGAGILYYSLHEEKVGAGLETRIDELGGRPTNHEQEGEY